MNLEIVALDEPQSADRDAIAKPLVAHVRQTYGSSGVKPLAFALRSTGGETVGGLWAKIAYGWLYIELLSIPEAQRGSGLGSELMRRAEAAARDLGLAGLWVDCFGTANQAFYEKLGYQTFGSIPGQPPGSERFFLKKTIPS